MWSSVGLITLATLFVIEGKIYERCELARELLEKHEAPKHQIATWVCIAQHESQFNTSAVGEMNGDESKDHGIFQISDLYWCSPPGHGWACGVTCAELEDDDIEDDFICAKRIYREHKTLSGNGFNAWVVYHTHCSGSVQSYIQGCFNETVRASTVSPIESSPSTSSDLSSSTSSTESPSTAAPSTSTLSTSTLKTKTASRGFLPNRFANEPDNPWFKWIKIFKWST